jgi:hypothetical protein
MLRRTTEGSPSHRLPRPDDRTAPDFTMKDEGRTMVRNPMSPSVPVAECSRNPFLSLHREMNRLIDDVFRVGQPAAAASQGQGDVPTFVNASMNASETDKGIRIAAELHGVAERDIDGNLNDDALTIRGESALIQIKAIGRQRSHHGPAGR